MEDERDSILDHMLVWRSVIDSKHPKRVSGRALGIAHFCRYLFFFSHGRRGELCKHSFKVYGTHLCSGYSTAMFPLKEIEYAPDMHLVQSLRKLQTIYKIKPLEITVLSSWRMYLCEVRGRLGYTKSSSSGK